MHCASCGFNNRAGAKFCNECGARLAPRCGSCGTENPSGARFCSECGSPFTGEEAKKRGSGEAAKRQKASPDTGRQTLDARLEGERRQLTVMFCDLVGSTALSEQLDPEELREVVRAYQEVSAAVIQRYEGHIAQYLGDGLLVYFGYPLAHEDDAQRAVRAGLGMVEASQHAPLLQQHGIAVRLGLHTGLVVVGEMGGGNKREQLALGDTPNIAARLQGLAPANAVVISGATYKLIDGVLDCQDLGSRILKGSSTPIQVYQVVGESGTRSRLDVAGRTSLTPLVGREEEVGLLRKRWEQVNEGLGQVVFVSGEAGIGKSRLLQVFKERLGEQPQTWLECRCSSYYQNSALYPLIDLLQRVLGFTRDGSPEEKLRKLEATLEDSLAVRQSDGLTEVVPLLASLLSLPLPDRYPPLTLTPQRQKQKTLETLLTWLLAEAKRQSVAFIVEDPHWADPSMLEFLGLLLDHAATARLLVILAFRPEFVPPWPLRSYMTQLTLSRLSRYQVEEMVNEVTRSKALPAEVVQQIVMKTDGVPLFVEELTKMVVESVGSIGSVASIGSIGSHKGTSLQALTIPATLHDSLMARLDRLGPAKEVAQIGAILGREFSYELLHAVAPVEETTLQHALTQLVEAELLYQHGLSPQTRYIFKHALVQDVAYQSLLKSTRQQYHRKIAQVLEEQFGETKEAQPELLAHHYTEAGLIAQAIPFWQRAGQRASQHSANAEAISHLTKGLELLKTLPDTPERVQQELTLQVPLGVALMAVKSWAAPEVERTYARAREICQQIGETPQLFPVLWGLWAFYVVRAEFKTARELGEQCLRLAQSMQDPTLLVGAHYALGGLLIWLGEFSPARAHLEQGIAFYTLQQHRSHASLYGWDLGVGCLWYVAWPLWLLGYPDQALQRIHEALTLAQDLAHPDSLDWALIGAASIHQFRREERLTQERAEAALALASEQGFALQLTRGTVLRGWALAEQGQGEEGITQLQQSLVAWQTLRAELSRSYDLTLLTEAYGKVGQT